MPRGVLMRKTTMIRFFSTAAFLLSVVAIAAEVSAESFIVPALDQECATVWYEEYARDSLNAGPLLKAGWIGEDERTAALISFDLSFLPPGCTITSVDLRLFVLSLEGDPLSYGNLSVGTVEPYSEANLEPTLEWAYAGRLGVVDFSGDFEVGAWISADVTAGVVDRFTVSSESDPGRLTFRVEFPAVAHESGDEDRFTFGNTPQLVLDVRFPDPITRRPDQRHIVRCIPVVASGAGALGTRWITQLQLADGDSLSATVWLYFTPTETDGNSTFTVRRIDLADFETIIYDNVLPDLFGLDDTKGWIEVFTSNPGLLVTARVANVGGEGSYGQTVWMVDERRAATWHGHRFTDTKIRHCGLGAVDTDTRTNVGLINLDPTESNVNLTARWTGGSAETTVTVPPLGHIQINRLETIIPEVSERTDFFLEIMPTSGCSTRRIIGYLTRVDNTTGDAVFIVTE